MAKEHAPKRHLNLGIKSRYFVVHRSLISSRSHGKMRLTECGQTKSKGRDSRLRLGSRILPLINDWGYVGQAEGNTFRSRDWFAAGPGRASRAGRIALSLGFVPSASSAAPSFDMRQADVIIFELFNVFLCLCSCAQCHGIHYWSGCRGVTGGAACCCSDFPNAARCSWAGRSLQGRGSVSNQRSASKSSPTPGIPLVVECLPRFESPGSFEGN